MAAGALLERLQGVRRTGEGRWLARCPAHPDKRASLSIRELEDGRVLVHDFAGCGIEEILGSVNLEFEALFPPRSPERGPRARQAYPAADVLRALADEAHLVAVAAANLAQGIELSGSDRERLLVAVGRIQAARELALGRQS